MPQYDAKQLRRAKELLGVFDVPKPKHSPMTFKEVAAKSGVPAPVVSVVAADNGIKPPTGMRGPRPGAKGAGRPKLAEPGTGKKLGPRSPHRRRAEELRALNMSYRDIAAQITTEIRDAATTPEEKEFQISQAAIYQLLNPSASDAKKKR